MRRRLCLRFSISTTNMGVRSVPGTLKKALYLIGGAGGAYLLWGGVYLTVWRMGGPMPPVGMTPFITDFLGTAFASGLGTLGYVKIRALIARTATRADGLTVAIERSNSGVERVKDDTVLLRQEVAGLKADIVMLTTLVREHRDPTRWEYERALLNEPTLPLPVWEPVVVGRASVAPASGPLPKPRRRRGNRGRGGHSLNDDRNLSPDFEAEMRGWIARDMGGEATPPEGE